MAIWGRILGRKVRSDNYDRGIRLFDQGSYDQAVLCFQKVLGDVSGESLVERLARFYLAESYSALAVSQLAAATPSGADHAIRNLREAVALNPNYADLHCHLAKAYFDKKQLLDALNSCREALAINPDFVRAMLLHGAILYALGSHDDALRAAARAVATDPMLSRDALAAACAAHQAADHEKALEALLLVGANQEDDRLFHARVGLDLYRRGMFAESIDSYRQALEATPDYADLRNQLGMALFAAERYSEANTEFTRAIAVNPRYVEARLNRALTLERMGSATQATEGFRSVLALDPAHQVARDHLESAGSIHVLPPTL